MNYVVKPDLTLPIAYSPFFLMFGPHSKIQFENRA